MARCRFIRLSDGRWRCVEHGRMWDTENEIKCGEDILPLPPIKITSDSHVYSPDPPPPIVTSVHYETNPKTGKRRVIIGFG